MFVVAHTLVLSNFRTTPIAILKMSQYSDVHKMSQMENGIDWTKKVGIGNVWIGNFAVQASTKQINRYGAFCTQANIFDRGVLQGCQFERRTESVQRRKDACCT